MFRVIPMTVCVCGTGCDIHVYTNGGSRSKPTI